MVAKLVVMATLRCALAVAEPEQPVPEREYLARTAQSAAAAGSCDVLADLASNVRQFHPAYYASTFDEPAVRRAVAACADVPGYQSPVLAGALSVGGTLGGVFVGTALLVESGDPYSNNISGLRRFATYGMAGAAFTLGPSLGRIYVGGAWNWWLGLRIMGVSTFVLGVALDAGHVTPRAVDAPADGLIFGTLVGGLVYTVGMIGENVATPLAAHEHNLALVPARMHDGAPGLALVGQF